MSYRFPAPVHHPTDEEKKLEVLKYLSRGCWLADTISKDATDTVIVQEHDHPAFFTEGNPWFDYPDANLLNEMVRDELLSVHISSWSDGHRENPHYNLRHFRLTEKGRAYYEAHREATK